MEQDSRCLSIESDINDVRSEATQNITIGNESWEDSVTLPTGSSSTLQASLVRGAPEPTVLRNISDSPIRRYMSSSTARRKQTRNLDVFHSDFVQ